MDSKKLFVYAPTQLIFEAKLADGTVDLNVIVFIANPRLIWALGIYYPCPYSKEEIDLIKTKLNALETQVESFDWYEN